MCGALIQQSTPRDLIYRYPHEYTPDICTSMYSSALCNYKQQDVVNIHQQGLVKERMSL